MALLDLLLAEDVEGFNGARGRHSSPSLHAADLSGRKLAQADLTRADLVNADLSSSDLSSAVLVQARLDGADLTAASLRGVIGHRSSWRAAYLGEADLRDAELPGAKMSNAELPGLRGENVNLSSARLQNADLEKAAMEGSNLDEAILSGASLIKADLSGASLQRANLIRADLTGATLKEANFGAARMGELCAPGAVMKGARFREADLTGANLEGADLEGADFTRADLGGANLRGARLRGAVIREACLDGVDLEGADLEGALLDAAGRGGDFTDEVDMDVPLRLEDLDCCAAAGGIGVLWENSEEAGTQIRVAVTEREGSWDGLAPAIPEPADLVVARALMPAELGFVALLFVKRPGGLVCRLTEISALGDVGASRTLRFPYVPAVQPAFLASPGGFMVAGLAAQGPTFFLHRYDGDGFELVKAQRMSTARGFVGRLAPVLLCKGGVAMPILPTGLGQVVSAPEGFPGRGGTAGRLGDAVFLAWIPTNERGLRYCIAEPGAQSRQGLLAPTRGVGSLDCVSSGERVLLAWSQEAETPLGPSTISAAWLPGGRAFPLLPAEQDDLDEVRIVAGDGPVTLSAVNLDNQACLAAVDEKRGRLLQRLGPSL